MARGFSLSILQILPHQMLLQLHEQTKLNHRYQVIGLFIKECPDLSHDSLRGLAAEACHVLYIPAVDEQSWWMLFHT